MSAKSLFFFFFVFLVIKKTSPPSPPPEKPLEGLVFSPAHAGKFFPSHIFNTISVSPIRVLV